jgi:hypothetical protein
VRSKDVVFVKNSYGSADYSNSAVVELMA